MNIRTITPLAATLLTVTIAAPALAAQEAVAEQQNPKTSRTSADYTSTSRLIGAPVYLEASMKAKEAARREGDEAERPTAKVTEWLVDSHDGKLLHAVVSVGGFAGIGDKIVLVPCKNLEWNQSMERFDLGWTEEQLKSQPAFDLDKACEEGLDKHCGVEAAAEKGVAEAASKKQEATKIAGTTFTEMPARVVRGSQLMALPVYAGPKSFGAASDLIVDRNDNRIVLAVVNHGATLGVGGTDYLVAFRNLRVCQNDDDRVLCAAKHTPEQLRKSEKFEKPKNGAVDPAIAKRALATERKGDEGDGTDD